MARKAEAALLAAVAADSPTQVSDAFGLTQKFAPELLALVVKPTFNDPKDRTAFYHSVASFGLDFVVGENITQLAKRNGMMEAFGVLDAMEKKLGLQPQRSLETEAQLLTAVSQDDGEEVSKLLACPHKEMLLQLRVKETYNDATDTTAFFHSVESHGLKFELGDTLLDLAERNERSTAVQSIKALTKLQLRIMNAMTGSELCSLVADSDWTMGRVAMEVAALAPAKGCRLFLLGEAALRSTVKVGELGSGSLELSSLLRTNVIGVYQSSFMPVVPELADPRFRLARPAARRAEMRLELREDGLALAEYRQAPLDTMRCAPPSGGLFVVVKGNWSFNQQGLAVSLEQGVSGHFIRMRPQEHDEPWRQKQVLSLSMASEEQLEIVEVTQSEGSRPIPCPVGAAFLKGETEHLIRHFRMD